MLILRHARVPRHFLPEVEVAEPTNAVEPTLRCDLHLVGDLIVEIRPVTAASETAPMPAGAEVVELAGALVFPGFVDAHVHLDKAHTWSRSPNLTGSFSGAITALVNDYANWTEADLRRRADFSLRSAWAHGSSVVRTHVDTWWPQAETSHAVMAELREIWRGRLELQTVALCGGDTYTAPDGEKLADLAIRHGASALGGFLQMGPELPRQIDRLLAIARDRRIGIDLHVDENGHPAAEVLRAVAEAVLSTGFPESVVCGHCCSLAVQAPARQRETLALVKEAGIGIISLPLCNLYLQDRREPTAFPRTPAWRGITLIQDFMDAGVPVACASDNVRDGFFAYGDFDPLEVYAQSVRLAQLENRLSESVAIITSAAADLVGRPDAGRIGVGSPAHLVITAAHSFSELLSRPSLPRRRVDGERVHTPVPPTYRELT